MTAKHLLWIGFHLFVFGMLILDLGVFHRKSHIVRTREALAWTGVWVALAMAFNGIIYLLYGPQSALEFLTGYLIEKSLSVDNIFVFLLIFSNLKVPLIDQHKVLFYGIVGALLMRASFILAGVTLITQFSWVIYVFGGFLILTGLKMVFEKERHLELERNPILRVFRRIMPMTPNYVESKFFVKTKTGKMATPLFMALIIVESTDIVFAIDSIPAILAITKDPFIVYTSNIFAIMGLRSLYFALSGSMQAFRYMKHGLSLILIFVGIKMVISDYYHIPVAYSLAVIFIILLATLVASRMSPSKD